MYKEVVEAHFEALFLHSLEGLRNALVMIVGLQLGI
jgi:hypothetical protein